MQFITSSKKKTGWALFLIFSILLLTFQSCKKKRPAIAGALFKITHNQVFREYTPEGFSDVLKKTFKDKKLQLQNAGVIYAFYEKNGFNPDLVTNHLFNGDLVTMISYYEKADEHGLSAKMFEAKKLDSLINTFNDKNKVKTLAQAYRDMAEIELMAANSLINYSNALQYGVINPKKIYQRYFMATKRPDSLFMTKIFYISNMQNYLDSIQPKSPQYIALQKVLISSEKNAGSIDEESKRSIIVNLERLRWKNKPFENKYVIVNIPDYTLNVIDSGRVVLTMKVCVGQGRNMDNGNSLAAYNDTAKKDKPFDHETPLLNSQIHSVQVNPVWNIPRSIANKEILVEAAKDRFYLANKSIDVYKDDKLVANPEDIDWTKVTKENSEYDFKQNPGEDNSLGKIKFLFKNKSSVYLHDTPAKGAFYKRMRAVSHGCVRLGDPQGLALNLFGPGDEYDTIAQDMDEGNPTPTTIYLPKRVPVYITYVTCWPDDDGSLQFRDDVYGLDIVLYDHLMKLTQQVAD
jgi:murein L,D-transpeptidase YcbB/YkuD